MDKIAEFQGEYRWLSNFWPCEVVMDGEIYPSTEHAYQAAKTQDKEIRTKIRNNPNPAYAKKIGKTLKDIPNWDTARLDVMEMLLRQKFSKEPFKSKLEATGEMEIVEGNKWYDFFWGVCNNVGQNNLGKLIMKIRNENRTLGNTGSDDV